jgi:hypothetical protein
MMIGYNIDVDAILPLIPERSVGVEIGVGVGDTSERLLTRTRWLHLVDPWSLAAYEQAGEFGGIAGYIEHYAEHLGTRDPQEIQRKFDAQYGYVSKRFVGKNVTIHRCRSQDFWSDNGDAQFDWAYIDGSHTFESCSADLYAAARVVRVIWGDDYNSGNPGVRHAVQRFVAESNWKVTIIGRQQYRLVPPC